MFQVVDVVTNTRVSNERVVCGAIDKKDIASTPRISLLHVDNHYP